MEGGRKGKPDVLIVIFPITEGENSARLAREPVPAPLA
jgi:hypothetical protein